MGIDSDKASLESALSTSKPVKIFMPQTDGSTNVYEVRSHAPTSLCPCRVNIRDKMRNDHISFPAVSVRLQGWASQHPEVQQISLAYYGNDGYLVAVLTDPFTEESMRATHAEIGDITSKFNGHRVIISAFGVEQSQDPIFTSVESHTVYSK